MTFHFEATGIGSVPFTDAQKASEFLVGKFTDIPFWPQLPKRSFLESMYAQYAEGFPGIVVSEKTHSVFVDTVRFAEELEQFYQRIIAKDSESFAISPDRAEGLYAFLETMKNAPPPRAVKGHITGPVSFALSITDQFKRSIIYDAELFDCATKLLSMKAAWQVKRLRQVSPNVIIFIDEPNLVSIGSGYITIDARSAKEKIEELIDAVRQDGVVCGIHCCGNTDWPFLLSLPIDILSFDAYNFIKQFIAFHKDIKKFLYRGGTIAWGVVPANQYPAESERELAGMVLAAIGELGKKGIERERVSSLVTPSCGVGTANEKAAEEILDLTNRISQTLRNG